MFSRVVSTKSVSSQMTPVIMLGKNTGCIFMFLNTNMGICLYDPSTCNGYKVGQAVIDLIDVNNPNWVKFDGVIELSNNKIGSQYD